MGGTSSNRGRGAWEPSFLVFVRFSERAPVVVETVSLTVGAVVAALLPMPRRRQLYELRREQYGSSDSSLYQFKLFKRFSLINGYLVPRFWSRCYCPVAGTIPCRTRASAA